MVGRGHEPAPPTGNGAGESFVSFIPLFDGTETRSAGASGIRPTFVRNRLECYAEINGGPITNSVLPEGSSRSKVRAPHSSFFGERRVVTLALHSR